MTTSKPDTESQTGTDAPPTSKPVSPMAVGGVAMQAWMDMSSEMVRFVWDRLQQDIKTQQAMLACTSLEQIQKVQAEFFRSAQEEYAAEARRMLEMIGKATTKGVAAAADTRRYDDLPL
jgi:hypothetical protein